MENRGLLIGGGVALVGCMSLVCLGAGGLFLFVGIGGPEIPYPDGPPELHEPSLTALSTHTHQGNCALANPRLTLTSFRIDYPAGYRLLSCTSGELTGGYATMLDSTGPDATAAEWMVGFAIDPVDQESITNAANEMAIGLGGSFTATLDASPLVARGQSLLRRDATFTTDGGTMIVRTVVVPNPGVGHGILLMYSVGAPVPGTALRSNDPDLLRVVESIQF